MYDDGDLRWYYLPEMVFRFVKEEDEWINVSNNDVYNNVCTGTSAPNQE